MIAPITITSAVIGAIIAIARPITIIPVVTDRTSHAGPQKAMVSQHMTRNTADDCAADAAGGVRSARR
jgi:hypothetical protein